MFRDKVPVYNPMRSAITSAKNHEEKWRIFCWPDQDYDCFLPFLLICRQFVQ